jgi:hypothetical protein
MWLQLSLLAVSKVYISISAFFIFSFYILRYIFTLSNDGVYLFQCLLLFTVNVPVLFLLLFPVTALQ